MPSEVTHADSARINLRTSPEVKAMIERAAARLGSTVTSYISQTMYENARQVLADADSLMLSGQAFEAFVATCEQPPPPSDALKKLMALR